MNAGWQRLDPFYSPSPLHVVVVAMDRLDTEKAMVIINALTWKGCDNDQYGYCDTPLKNACQVTVSIGGCSCSCHMDTDDG